MENEKIIMKTLHLNIQEQNIFFTSDLHLDHKNIIEYCERPFPSIEDMNLTIETGWNNTISNKDIVFILGDFCFGSKLTWRSYLDNFNGVKYFIEGNHDKNTTKDKFVEVTSMRNIMIEGDDEIPEGQRMTLCHYPMLSWYQSHRGAWQLYGHVHGAFSRKGADMSRTTPNQLDVGVDVHNFTPLSYHQVKTIITKQNLK